MEVREGNLNFGKEIGKPFRLHVRIDAQGHSHLTLFCGEIAVPKAPLASRVLLQFFLENPGDVLTKSAIDDALHIKNLETAVSDLRECLAHDDYKNPTFIETVEHLDGYRFKQAVTRDGDLGCTIFPRWRVSILDRLLKQIEPGPGKYDLRIVTVAFGDGLQQLGFDLLLARNVRIGIVMMDPTDDAIMVFRHGLRQDGETPESGAAEIRKQIGALSVILKQYKKAHSNGTGSIELKLSRAMPAAFIAHTHRRAVAGLFLAGWSYFLGPMIEADRDTEPWKRFENDWQLRWDNSPQLNLLGDVASQLKGPLPPLPAGRCEVGD